jgi:hypothetical protein
MRVYFFLLAAIFVFYKIIFISFDPPDNDSKEVKLKLMNSTTSDQKVTLQEIGEDGSLSEILYSCTVSNDQVEMISVRVARYNIKICNINTGEEQEINRCSVGENVLEKNEMVYYLDLSLDRDFAVSNISNVKSSVFSTPDFSLYKIYDGSKPFQFARKLIDEDKVFLQDTTSNLLSFRTNFYGITPIKKGLTKAELKKYLSKQIRMLYK